ncbi:MAG: tRNA pseudouridine(38-40) synthase TruA [Gemmatimonadota bacterium]|nr:MAG: tRNA pseudouridine(38-40) synthase TruA [Gemmatimonadota bacterium]
MSDLPLARFRATIQYDGTGFRGWQLQPGERTVQGDVERALGRLLAARCRVSAAGRTDTGVHAVGQEISFDAPRRWAEADLLRGLNALLPRDVWIERLRAADPDFQPRFRAEARRYEYLASDLEDGASPVLRGRIWHIGTTRTLDPEQLSRFSQALVGEHSFAALSKSGQPERGTRCRVVRAEWTRTPTGLLHFTIVADRFLHRMVRYVVTTLIEAATGRREAADLARLLAAGDPAGGARAPAAGTRSPVPAPACGLYLTGVRYGDGWNRPPGIPGFIPTRTRQPGMP